MKDYDNESWKCEAYVEYDKLNIRPMEEGETLEEYHDDTYGEAVEEYHKANYKEWVTDFQIISRFYRRNGYSDFRYSYRITTVDGDVIEGDIGELATIPNIENVARVIDTSHYLGVELDLVRAIKYCEEWYESGYELIAAVRKWRVVE